MNADEIKATRTRLKLQQTELAEILGVTAETVSRWENGHHEPLGAWIQALEELALVDPAKFSKAAAKSEDLFDLVARLRRMRK